MIKFPAQYHNFRKNTLGENIITFSVDGNYSRDIMELVSMKIGTEFVVYLEDVTSETNINYTPTEITDRFTKKLHALLGELALLKGVKPNAAKNKLKEALKKKGLIVKSTKELDIKGQAIACNIVEAWMKESEHD